MLDDHVSIVPGTNIYDSISSPDRLCYMMNSQIRLHSEYVDDNQTLDRKSNNVMNTYQVQSVSQIDQSISSSVCSKWFANSALTFASLAILASRPQRLY